MLAPRHRLAGIINRKRTRCREPDAVNAIYPYQTQEVRDLAWACFSPSLMSTRKLARDGTVAGNCGLEFTDRRRAWLEQLDRDATPLLQHLARQRSHRLGVYFEHLWHFLLLQDPEVDLVAHNLAVHHQGRTLGEFDCLYFCHRRQCHVHLELAVKYFLSHRQSGGTEAGSGWQAWLGPNTADRLDLKIDHLMQRQIRLGDNPVAREKLKDLGIGKLAREVEIKGYLFQSLDDPLPPPRGFNPQRRLETWLGIGSLQAYLQESPGHRYLCLPKVRWLSPVVAGPAERVMDALELGTLLSGELARDHRPALIAALDHNGRESHRFFITGDHWPGHRTPVRDGGDGESG